MPALSTRGGALSRIPRYPEKQTSVGVTGVCYFNHGATGTLYRSNTREKFTFATSAVVASTNLANMCANQSATSNTSTGIIATGFNGANTPAKEKFIFSSETSVITTSFTGYNTYSASIGNATIALTQLGWGSTYTMTRNSHTYATDTVALAASATSPSYAGCGFGIREYALFSLGGTAAGPNVTIDKIVYATGALTGYTALGVGNSGGCAGGNGTSALVGIGNARTTYLVTYATATIVAGSLIPVKTIYGSVGANNTNLIFCLGGTDVTNASNKKYNYTQSSKTFALTTNSLVATWGGSAMSTTITGVND